MKQLLKYLKCYCNCNSPSGYENEIREAIISDLKKVNCDFSIDTNGNILVFKRGANKRDNKVLLSAHMDEIGFMISYINPDGLLSFLPVGGINPFILPGKRVISCRNDIGGVILSKPVYMQQQDEIGAPPSFGNLFIDIGLDYNNDSLDVRIGDYFTFDSDYCEFGQSSIRAKAIDDRFGCALLMDIINSELKYDTYFSFTTCEETGLDGAFIVSQYLVPDIVIVVEATTANDIGFTKKEDQACALGEGAVISIVDTGTAYDKTLIELAMSVAQKRNIRFQIKNVVAGGNEARAFQNNAGSKVLSISVPTRYIHSPSCVVLKEDLNQVKELICDIIKDEI